MDMRPARRTTRLILMSTLLWTVAAFGPHAGASEPGLRLSCTHDPDDAILAIICDRVLSEAPVLAASHGYRMGTDEGSGAPGDGPTGRSLAIALTATRPASRFATKRIDARLSGSYAGGGAGTWSGELSAEGVARDLVHPVADAVLERIEAFLASPAPE